MKVSPVEKFSKIMLDAEQYIRHNPEIGYKEHKTQAYLIEQMTNLGYKINAFDDITGFSAVYDSGKTGPTLLVFGELDALINKGHPECDKQTGAVHSCGHNVQCATLLGVAGALKQNMPDISGKVKFCFVPAEEGIDYNYRKNMIDNGIIKYVWGKPELIYRGMFDDGDLALLVHTYPNEFNGKKFYINLGNNGNNIKQATFIGKSAHAGGSPHLGINALNTASCAINVINSLRETFKDDDHVRFHSIITNGGDSVNTVPEKVVVNSYVRGANIDAINDANNKINNAIKGVSVAFGANVIIEDRAGSMPLKNDSNMIDLAVDVLDKTFGTDSYVNSTDWGTICTDFGDISALMPSLQIFSCGMNGPLHGTTSNSGDLQVSVIDSAIFQYEYIVSLLKNDGNKANQIISSFIPTFKNKKEYLDQKNRFDNCLGKKIQYNNDGSILIKP